MLARGEHRHSYGLLTLQHPTESAKLPLLKEVELWSVAVLHPRFIDAHSSSIGKLTAELKTSATVRQAVEHAKTDPYPA
ncbi:hypothetical protein GO281_04698 [Ralstonia solanacearum]|nr:hypothetical protein [Ralstonia solanacearum]